MRGEAPVSSAQVAAYDRMVEAHARRISGWSGLEGHADDLAQEGRIAVWKALRDGHHPSNVVVLNAMRDYARVERRKGIVYDELTADVEAR